ncbi:VOC family protein [Antarctobacter jejuensis]|uniref:VOC family protein n=1 Tax=Antarctobacter jejuensis TaxID=1439938 RepID=UPI003FD1DBF6
MSTTLEHVNIAVPDPRATAALLQEVFGWRIRWEGPAKDNGHTVHVGNEETYLALYAPARALDAAIPRYRHEGSLCHIGLRVTDLKAAEEAVRAAGYAPHSHADYEPGQRFYFDGPDAVEYEVVSYA